MSPQLKSPRTNDLRTAVRGRWRLGAVVMTATLAAVLSLSQVGGATTTAAPAAAKLAAATTATHSMAATSSSATAAKTASSTPTTAAATTIQVAIQNYAFSPSTLNVKVGDTVTWTNMDTAPHTVTVSSGPVKFASGNLAKGDKFSYTFKTAGTYSYYCAVHPDMKGTVVVTGSGTPTPTPTPTDPMNPPTTGDKCEGLMAAENALLQHIYAGHLEESPGQQVQDALNVDQYVKTHTVLAENLVKPLVGSLNGMLDTFLQHVYAGHLEESPGQQVQDILNIDEYAKTHTVLVENLLKPLIGTDISGC